MSNPELITAVDLSELISELELLRALHGNVVLDHEVKLTFVKNRSSFVVIEKYNSER